MIKGIHLQMFETLDRDMIRSASTKMVTIVRANTIRICPFRSFLVILITNAIFSTFYHTHSFKLIKIVKGGRNFTKKRNNVKDMNRGKIGF